MTTAAGSTPAPSRSSGEGRDGETRGERGGFMRFRALWIGVPACAAAGAMTFSMVAAQESLPKASPKGVVLKPAPPDTRAAQSMFGPPPGMTGNGVTPVAGSEPVQPPLFFPN